MEVNSIKIKRVLMKIRLYTRLENKKFDIKSNGLTGTFEIKQNPFVVYFIYV